MSDHKLSSDEIRAHKGVSFTGITTAFMCHDGHGKIFLTKRSKHTRDEHGNWDAGGGGLKHGQSLEDNLKREIKEEYDADPLNIEFLGYLDAFRTNQHGQATHWLAMYFAVLVDPKQVKINEPDMVDDSGWFTLDQLPKPMHSMWSTFYAKHGVALEKAMNSKRNG